MTTTSITLQYIKSRIEDHEFGPKARPQLFCLSGPQGSGKSFLSSELTVALKKQYPQLNIVQFSMDDLYLTHAKQEELTIEAKKDGNKLLQGRGLPGTHDLSLALSILNDIVDKKVPLSIPQYDKSLFNGEGDRVQDIEIHDAVDVLIFEGWFNGFKALSDDVFRLTYLTSDNATSTLKHHRMYHLEDINSKLRLYGDIWNYFDSFVFLQTENINNVYRWRLEQEHDLMNRTGKGMTNSQVEIFVKRYLPVYELFYIKMCDNGLAGKSNLRLVIDENRHLLKSEIF